MDEVEALRDIVMKMQKENSSMKKTLVEMQRFFHHKRHTDSVAMELHTEVSLCLNGLGITIHETMESVEQ